MNAREAPLYVEAHDLAGWLIARVNSWPVSSDRHLAPLVATTACNLVSAVALALTFPSSRWEHLEEADRSVVRLRTQLRLARQVSLLSAGALRFAAGRLQTIGRMIGGWKKKQRQAFAQGEKPTTGNQESGDGPPAAITA